MDHLRAAFVLFHLVAVTLLAIPAPVGAMSRKSFDGPDGQRVLGDWASAISAIGPDIDREALSSLLWDAGSAFLDARSVVLRPFRPYYQLAGTRQGWRMFGTVDDTPARLRIEVDEGDGWRVLYEARSDEHVWRRRLFDQERTRAFVNSWAHLRGKASYEQFADWVAAAVGEDLPDALAVRLTMLRRRTPEPDVLWRDGFPPDQERWVVTRDVERRR